ncbi:uncharacterized protein LOC124306290 [Neodiprion virginianus]|uniref:uncharacterized protein LOC124306290 n=1 Tax=Neodiprion virginianus TaxID=2961670 RepID=UPI001EE6AFFD|nr:uncharacterized protein LOC124306290 [Neodiprion virginianus]
MDTVMELTTSGISWAVNHEFWLYSIINAEEPKILETQASKIHSYWRTDVVQQHFDIRTQLAVHSDNLVTHDPVKMTVGQVQGTFYILAIGLAISGLVFLKELYDAQKSTRQRKKEIEGY